MGATKQDLIERHERECVECGDQREGERYENACDACGTTEKLCATCATIGSAGRLCSGCAHTMEKDD